MGSGIFKKGVNQMSFNGNLLYLCQPSTIDTTPVYDIFNLDYVYKESYKVVPNRRQDLDSGRNTTGLMIRNVLDHYVSTISFTVKTLNNTELASLMSFITSHYVSAKEKKIYLRYYCPDIDDYKTGYFYIPDIEYPITMVDVANHLIRYGQFTLEFIEY